MFNLFKNKLFLLIILFILIINCFNNFSNAAYEVSTMPENILNNIYTIINDNYNYSDYAFVCFQTLEYSDYRLFVVNKNDYPNWNPYFVYISNQWPDGFYPGNVIGDMWVLSSSGSYSIGASNHNFGKDNWGICMKNLNSYYLLNTSITYRGQEDFFYPSPLPITKITQVLTTEMEKAQIMEQMKIMIVGFLKYLAVLVISLLAFWKGWQFLSMQLRKA